MSGCSRLCQWIQVPASIQTSINPEGRAGECITDRQLDDGTRIEVSKNYKVAGWATDGPQSPGAPVWDVIADYLRSGETASIKKLNIPKLKNTSGNPGIA